MKEKIVSYKLLDEEGYTSMNASYKTFVRDGRYIFNKTC